MTMDWITANEISIESELWVKKDSEMDWNCEFADLLWSLSWLHH